MLDFEKENDFHSQVLARFLDKQGRSRSVTSPTQARPRHITRPPQAPSSGMSSAHPYDFARPKYGLDPLREHESALDSPLSPAPVSGRGERARILARTSLEAGRDPERGSDAQYSVDTNTGLYINSPPDDGTKDYPREVSP